MTGAKLAPLVLGCVCVIAVLDQEIALSSGRRQRSLPSRAAVASACWDNHSLDGPQANFHVPLQGLRV